LPRVFIFCFRSYSVFCLMQTMFTAPGQYQPTQPPRTTVSSGTQVHPNDEARLRSKGALTYSLHVRGLGDPTPPCAAQLWSDDWPRLLFAFIQGAGRPNRSYVTVASFDPPLVLTWFHKVVEAFKPLSFFRLRASL